MSRFDDRIDELEFRAKRALRAEVDRREDWAMQWADSLELLHECFDLFEEEYDFQDQRVWPALSVVLRSAELIRDECRGAKAHFWQKPRRRPPRSNSARERLLLLAILVSACSEKRRREGLSQTSYSLAQRELSKWGFKMSQSEIRSAASNSNKLPRAEREILHEYRADLRAPEANPDHKIAMAVESLAEMNCGFRR